ncbi:DinB family protein [Pradoshia sp.]
MLKRHEVLIKQLADYRHEFLETVSSVREEEVDIIPEGYRNNIRWHMGHVYVDQYLWIQHLTKEEIVMPKNFIEWFGYGTSPLDWGDDIPSVDYLKKLLAIQPFMIRDLYGERLEEHFPTTESGMHTIAQVLVRTIFHEGIHLANVQAIKRAAATSRIY